jgi:enoyl-CoA hydratase
MANSESQTPEKVQCRKSDGIAVLTLDDPPANTYSYEMMQELDAAILDARMDAAVHVIVITGAGDRFFCAGANIGMLKEADAVFKYYFCLHANETLNRLEQTPKLVIAALNGHTVGGGLEVAMAADLRIARHGAGKIGLPEVALGVLPGTGGTQRLARLLGKAKAIELMTLGSLVTFEEAHALGLVNHVWGEAELNGRTFHAAILEWAAQFVPPNRASKAVGHIKRAVQSGLEMGFSDALALERELQQRLFESEDAREGIAASLEKRKPSFTGR